MLAAKSFSVQEKAELKLKSNDCISGAVDLITWPLIINSFFGCWVNKRSDVTVTKPKPAGGADTLVTTDPDELDSKTY